MRNERKMYELDISLSTPEELPFNLLTDAQQGILQQVADGYTNIEIASKNEISTATVEKHKENISAIGFFPRIKAAVENNDSLSVRQTLLALIQDGIVNGYIKHDCPKASQLKQLTPVEHDTMRMVLNGMTHKQIAKERKRDVSTIEAYLQTIYIKLGLGNRRNFYRAVARYTYLTNTGFFEKPKEQEHSEAGAF